MRQAWTAEGPILFDTSEVYGLGASERALRGASCVATKVMPHPWRRPRQLLDALDASLERLGADRVRLCLLHFPVRLRDNSSWIRALCQAVHSGRAEGIGISNHDLGQAREAWRVAREEGVPLEVLQDEYHLDARDAERELLPFCRDKGLTFQAFRPLDGGRLPPVEALSFLLEQPGVQPIVGTLSPQHAREALALLGPHDRATPAR